MNATRVSEHVWHSVIIFKLPETKRTMQLIKKRLPTSQEIQNIFGFLVFVIFTWSIRGFLYKLPSFLLYYGVGKIIGTLAYMLSFSLVESIVLFMLLLVVVVSLPGAWLRNGFSWKAGLLILALSAFSLFLQSSITFRLPSAKALIIASALIVTGLFTLWFLCAKYQRVRTVTELTMENFSIFVYLYLPLGLLSVLIVILRNVF